MSNWKMVLASALVVVTSAASAFADCSDIAGADTPDGAWLVSLNGIWKPISELSPVIADGRPRDVNFAYVARESDPSILRRGILVIKTGVRAPTAANSDKVALARDAYTAVEQCEFYPRFNGGSVRGRSYDDYHDFSYSVEKGDQATLESFHVTYARRGQGCRRSNDDSTDSYFTGRWQSNRSQFSFDEGVVTGGQHSQFLAQFGVTPAYAAASLSGRRVEMKRYVADKNGLACVAFSVSVKPGTFIRINDLERRNGLFRAPEQSWEWPR